MRKTAVFIITFILLTTAAHAQWWSSGKKIKGNGNMTTITRTTPDYDHVKVAGAFDVALVDGSEGKLTLEGESNLLEYIDTEVDGDVLKIKVRKGYNLKMSSRKKLIITVPFRDLNSVSLSGSGDVYTKDATIKSSSFKAALAGSGDIILDLDAKKLKAAVAGSGDMILRGEADSMETKLAGSGDISAYKLRAKDVDVKLSGSGDIRINVTEKLKARVAGSGDIMYKGNPTSKDTKVAGSGSITMN